MKIFKNLPNDIIVYILSYDNKIKYRNGKYINQIKKSDKRYELVKQIPKPTVLIDKNILFQIIIVHINSKKFDLKLSKVLHKSSKDNSYKITYYLFLEIGLSCITKVYNLL